MQCLRAPLRILLVGTRFLGHTPAQAASGAATRAQTIMEPRLTCARLRQQNAPLSGIVRTLPLTHKRWRLLELRALHGWSLDDTAADALVTAATGARWEREATGPERAHP